jgi:hypothetical protein
MGLAQNKTQGVRRLVCDTDHRSLSQLPTDRSPGVINLACRPPGSRLWHDRPMDQIPAAGCKTLAHRWFSSSQIAGPFTSKIPMNCFLLMDRHTRCVRCPSYCQAK